LHLYKNPINYNKGKGDDVIKSYPLVVFFFKMLLLYKSSDIVPRTGLNNHFFENKPTYSVFVIPTKKKSVIFLRAPYKNKLARLNIVQLRYSMIMSLKQKMPEYIMGTNDPARNNLTNMLNYFGAINFSSYRLKHVKTKIKINICFADNYTFQYFNTNFI
jgi:hypothetical protein